MAIKYKALAEELIHRFESASRRGTDRLPTEAALCREYQVSRQTVRCALALLEERGIITKRQGSGSYYTGLSADVQNNVIAVLLPDDQYYTNPGLSNDICEALSQNGFVPQLCFTHDDIGMERRVLLSLCEKPPRGVIAGIAKSALPNPNTDLFRKLQKSGSKIVFLESVHSLLSDIPYVKAQNLQGSTVLTSHLLSLGHSVIGGIFDRDSLSGVERYQGLLEALVASGNTPSDLAFCWYSTSQWNALEQSQDTSFLADYLQRIPHNCTAVICQNDEIAHHFIAELRRAGYQVPGDMAVASFDNSYINQLAAIGMTSLSHGADKIGVLAARALMEQLKGLPAQSQEVPWSLIIRESTQLRL